ncbi:MAG: class I mannose-6-phosphate isomerase [Candidatus Eisenbacteria bacterium]|uniref:Class I mannose-6-phosphate isomerase n=1 Tax=Eiseniibacteriota bacterium TaxID=2212470 RepID=A0A937XC14_UNCEI|nr:class I mannose-6-phosphate isomerase [Candidatus Eisenbacteria bacterium]
MTKERELYPYLFEPVYKPYPWGGDRFARCLGRQPGSGVRAESWEISDRPEGMSILRNGPLAGRSLADLVRDLGADLIGPGPPAERFPLLFKLLDARERTSLQVHPTEDWARSHGGEPKSELWYSLPGAGRARLYAGLRAGVDRGRFAAALAERRLEPLLQAWPIDPGEAIFIPGGCVHAIDAGCFLYEVQLNSDTTLRVHDWDRRAPDGTSRPLHIEEALSVIRWPGGDAQVGPPRPPRREVRGPGGGRFLEVHSSPHFRVLKLEPSGMVEISPDERGFQVLYVERGGAVIEGGGRREALPAGTSCLVPAALSRYALGPIDSAGASVLLTTR